MNRSNLSPRQIILGIALVLILFRVAIHFLWLQNSFDSSKNENNVIVGKNFAGVSDFDSVTLKQYVSLEEKWKEGAADLFKPRLTEQSFIEKLRESEKDLYSMNGGDGVVDFLRTHFNLNGRTY